MVGKINWLTGFGSTTTFLFDRKVWVLPKVNWFIAKKMSQVEVLAPFWEVLLSVGHLLVPQPPHPHQ